MAKVAMHNLYGSATYLEDLREAASQCEKKEQLRNSSVLVTGASGIVGSFFVDLLCFISDSENLNLEVIASGRNSETLASRFEQSPFRCLRLEKYDVESYPQFTYRVDYIVHAASNAHPVSFTIDPVGTLTSNVMGTKNLLDYGYNNQMKGFLFISSGEVYGQSEPGLESLVESYSGYVDPLKVRSSYPTAKRAAESLCISFEEQYGIQCKIARLSHTYGPTAQKTDSRAHAQFISAALNGDDIVLNSPGKQFRSYCYVADTCSALLTILLEGSSSAAYNVANVLSAATIAEFAETVASISHRKVVRKFADLETDTLKTPIERQVLNAEALEKLGWKGTYSLERGIEHTLRILGKE